MHWKKNPRRNGPAVDKVVASMRRFGFGAPLLARRANREIVAGHTRALAAQKLGVELVPVRFLDLSEEDAHLLALADNKLGEIAEWDDDGVLEILSGYSLDDAALAGWDKGDLEALAEGAAGPATEDEAPTLRAEAATKTGDLYELGPHRLLCGDSTVSADVARVMDGRLADIVWTDPPYGVAYVGGTKNALTIENDDLDPDALRAFLANALGLACEHSRPGAAWYVASPSGGHVFGEFARVLGREGLAVWRHTLTWVKDSLVMGQADYHYRHEEIFYGWKPGAAHYFIDDRTQDSVWEISRPRRSEDHPTMKPVELVARALRNSSRKGELVFEPFGGSGTTLIAAEQTGRIAAVIEKSPQYCDVIVRRWEALTGKTAVLARAP